MRAADERAAREGLAELVREFDSALLVFPATNGSLRSRPMAVARELSRAELWFRALVSPARAEEIARASEVLVTMRRGHHWLALNGTLEIHRRASSGEQGSPGERDPDLALARLVPTIAEYWDDSGTGALYVAIHGERIAFDDAR